MKKYVLALIFLGLMFCNMGNASGDIYEFIAQVPNDGPTNFVGTNIKPADDSGTVWTPLLVGDAVKGINDFGVPVNIPVGAKNGYVAPAPITQVNPIAPVNYDTVRQIPNDGPTNFVGTNSISLDDSGTVWTPLNIGDTITKVDDFGNVVNVPVGPKIVLQKRSIVNSWLTLSRKGGALRIIN